MLPENLAEIGPLESVNSLNIPLYSYNETFLQESTSLSTTKSRALTQSLLNLDLGYSVLNEELMRRSMGLDVDRLDGWCSQI